MRVLPRIHDLYVARVVAVTILLSWAVLLGLDVVMALVGQVKDIGTGNYGFVSAVAHVAYTVPFRAYTLFPTAAVIGTLMGLGQLATSSELTALRALGLSRRRLSASVALVLAVITALMMLNAETLGPWSQRRADGLKAAAKSSDMIVAQYSGLWAREGDVFLNAQSGQERSDGDDAWLELDDVRLYEFAADGRLESIAHAGKAEHRPTGWLLRDVRRTWFDDRSVTQTEVLEERWTSRIDAAALAVNARNVWRPRTQTMDNLRSGIDYRRRNGLSAGEFEEHYWGRWFYPANVLALCLAAMPFAFGTLRSGGLGKRLFTGIVFALAFFLLQKSAVSVAGAFKVDYRLVYLAPILALLAVSGWLFRKPSG